MPVKVPGTGQSYSPLMIVAESPGDVEVEKGMTLVGPTSKQVDQFLQKAGHEGIDACYRTNVYKYQPTYQCPIYFYESLPECKQELFDEIRSINPNVILALGNHALTALTGKSGIKKWRGSLLVSETGHKVIPSIHPAYIYKKHGEEKMADEYKARIYIQEDFKKAVRESYTDKLNIPQRQIQICRRPEDLLLYLKTFQGFLEYAWDIESFKGIPTCGAISFHPHSALVVPTANLKASQSFPRIPETFIAEYLRILEKLLTDPLYRRIGQNLKYDDEKYERVFGIYPLPPYLDTSILAKTLYPELPKSLEFLTSVHTNEPYYKDEGKEFDWRKMPIERLYVYNGKDSCLTLEVSLVLRKHLEEFEEKFPGITEVFYNHRMKLHALYMGIERIGLKVDFQKRQELYDKYLKLCLDAWKDAQDIAGKHINISSPKQVAHFLFDILEFPAREGTGEHIITMLYANHAYTEREKKACVTILNGRRYRKTLGTYIMKEPDTDGRMRTSYDIAGKETGRTSTKVLRPPLRPFKNIGMAFHTISKHGDIGQDVGHEFIADEGFEFINFDLSQAEPRIVANLSMDFDLLERFDKIDVHKESAGVCFSLDDEEAQAMDKEDPRRFVGKTCKNGINYDMRKGRLTSTVNDDAMKYHIDIHISEAEAGQMLRLLNEKYPNVKGIFHEEIKKALVDNNMVLISPWGTPRQFFGRWGDQVHKEAYAHIPQNTVTGKIQRVMLEAKRVKPMLMIVAENHDAFVILSKLEERLENIQLVTELMESPIDFSRCSLPRNPLKIPCGIEIGTRYNDFKKFRRAA